MPSYQTAYNNTRPGADAIDLLERSIQADATIAANGPYIVDASLLVGLVGSLFGVRFSQFTASALVFRLAVR